MRQLDQLGEHFADLDRLVKIKQALGHTTILKELEGFFCGLLSLVYDWSLVDANIHLSTNAEAIDLIDPSSRVSVQVTVTTGAKKIHDTLKAFQKAKLNETYDRVVMIYPFLGVNASTAPFASDCPSLDFDAKRDCLCLDNLLQALQEKANSDKNEKVILYLAETLKKHGRTGAFTKDANVSCIIDVINHLTDDTSTPPSNEPVSVDQEKKFARFVEYASWLKRQYTDNLECYASVAAAESAVGMDHIRGKRVASWIRFQSSNLLDTYNNDAKKAFNALVNALFQTVGKPVNELDEIAVRYFLATHLSRCNVFPNPT